MDFFGHDISINDLSVSTLPCLSLGIGPNFKMYSEAELKEKGYQAGPLSNLICFSLKV